MATTTVTIRIDESLKQAATQTFEDMGLSLANGISIYLTRVAATKEIPFPVAVPEYKPSASFGLRGNAYHEHLLQSKQQIEDGRYAARELAEN